MQYLTLLSLVPAVMAYGYGSSDATTTAAVAAAQTSGSSTSGIQVIKVGQNGLTFDPESVTVPVGQTVEFHFWPKAHSVARSSFDAPCAPLNGGSFFSGPVQIANGMSPTVFSITVNDTNPIWYYCATGQHCQNGMGGVINPPSANLTRTVGNYKALAAQQASNVAPPTVQGGRLGAQATTSPTTSTTGSAASGSASAGAGNKGALSWGLLGAAGLIGAAMV